MKYSDYVKTPLKCDEDAICRYEQGLCTRLPNDYRNFLLETGGGEPAYRLLEFVKYPEQGATVLGGFYNFSQDDPLIEKVKRFHQYKIIPKKSIPIAFDMGSNKVVLYLAGWRKGQVWFNTMDGEMFRLAYSFGSFLVQLKQEDTEVDAKAKPDVVIVAKAAPPRT